MSHILTIRIAQNTSNLCALMAQNSGDFGSGIVDESSPNFLPHALPAPPVWPRVMFSSDDDKPDDFLLGKVALDIDHTNGQQTGLGEKSLVGTFVDVQRAMGIRSVEEPEVAIPNWIC